MNEREAAELATELYASLYSPLLRFAAHSTGSLELAEDVVQETFTRLYRELRQGHRIANPRAWAFSVVRREIGRQRRGEHALGVMEPVEILDHCSPPLGAVVVPFAGNDDVGRFLSILSPREAEVVLLRLGNLKYREIGAELGIGVKSVGKLLARALVKLHRAVTERLSAESATDRMEVKTARLKTLQ